MKRIFLIGGVVVALYIVYTFWICLDRETILRQLEIRHLPTPIFASTSRLKYILDHY